MASKQTLWLLANPEKAKAIREAYKEKQRELDKKRNGTRSGYNRQFYLDNCESEKERSRLYNIKVGKSTGTGQTTQEKLIEQWLIRNNFSYVSEKSMCKNDNGNDLYFDFWLPKNNILIEFDGEYHFRPIFGENKFNKQKEHDKIKDKFCQENNIKLIRISYLQENKMKEILSAEIS